ncbi:MAG: hypothetical protein IJ574_02510 [Bacilli bacterium]|nr:hypothetical protein [Bacilli bacterium]
MDNENRSYLKRSEGEVIKIVMVAEFISLVEVRDTLEQFTMSKVYYTHNLDLQVGDLVDIEYSIKPDNNNSIDFKFTKKELENKIRR